jgi:hypothetical protein
VFVLPGDGDLAVRPIRQSLNRFVLPLVLLPLFAGGCVWTTGAYNPYTPAGYVGYLTKSAVFGKSRFYGVQRGPTSAGRTWLLEVTNVSVTPYTYTEEFVGDQAVLSRDNLKISFAVHIVWRVDQGRVPPLHGALQHHGHERIDREVA